MVVLHETKLAATPLYGKLIVYNTGLMLRLHSEIQSADRIFYRPINILSADWSDYIKDISHRLPKSVTKLYNRPMINGKRRSSADTSADDK